MLDSLLQEIKWNRESVHRFEQSVRGYIKKFYSKKTGVPPTRGWMLKDSYMFGHSRPYKVQIDFLSPSEPKRFKQFGYDSLMKTKGRKAARRLMKAILEGKKVIGH
jgi:hypothetical protein